MFTSGTARENGWISRIHKLASMIGVTPGLLRYPGDFFRFVPEET